MFEAFFLAHALMDRELCLGRLLRIVWQEILYKTSRKRTHLILLLLLIVGNCYCICLQKTDTLNGTFSALGYIRAFVSCIFSLKEHYKSIIMLNSSYRTKKKGLNARVFLAVQGL